MSKLQIKLNDGTRYDIEHFNDSYIAKATMEMEYSDELQYRVVAQLSNYSLDIDKVKDDFVDENLKNVSIVYVDGDTEIEQIAYVNMHLERINKYFSVESGTLSSGYDVVFSK